MTRKHLPYNVNMREYLAMRKVRVYPKSIRSYKGLISDELYSELIELAKPLKGARILHINSTSNGGGVAEILRSEVPLLHDLGLDVSWQVIEAGKEFFDITKGMHNALQGNGKIVLNSESRKLYERVNAYNAHLLKAKKEQWDFVFFHDPQPLAIPHFYDGKDFNAIWRCHIHVSPNNKAVWDYLKRFLDEYDAGIFSLKEFIPGDLPIKKRFVIPPAIDPLTPKNKKMDELRARKIVEKLGVDTRRPLVTQVSRFDLWKDPLGVIKAYIITKKRIPELQLALVGSAASDDPEGMAIYRQLKDYVKTEKDIKILKDLTEEQVNAFQTISQIILQKSIKEGFGLTVSEAMFKETPVIGGNVGGIRLQIVDGKNGCLVDSPMECAKRMAMILEDTHLRLKMGRAGKQIVSKYFLTPRLIRDELMLMSKFPAKKENIAKINVLF
ncbi:MAG: Glycosyltransferase [candidate division CPR2 bacterium GW2011_GWC1_41_48]|uniref:Glycosyltransferase n=1 Tax=candidate division CPR2 bacterium GW2011_GWC1_41_48 TaxID=1618344 RepID=A0A0G0ZA20_UNCC2|nr:MAG: Glycosyl transferase, group 1 [candidate division CPR2 bacterium GW2011_GWC2_39_35]KKR28855.1 MAG: Glycosyl transferase, group 1 [candidate division CPR2 bacterium GW2011_GWD2_39_7]KKR29387.1 MAG: Glycosyl transferase, group 1 [candidate division CPR2 bacterium GW2011_GWD1_39_7]KKS09898.1 MAG: Glycosyltransferase [candidate division CPR2 bacterium GW2011_GWC1_41_48]